jgi:hypothetical protein
MTPDPGAIFGGLLRGCISDRYLPREKMALEGMALMILGMVSSLVTTYVLASVGILV